MENSKPSRSKVQVGKTVFSEKSGEGVITSILTASTGYVQVTYKSGVVSKEMAFNLKDEAGVNLRKKPFSETEGMSRGEKKRFKDQKASEAFAKLSNQKQIESSLMSINGAVYGDRNSLKYTLWEEKISEIKEKAEEKSNDFIFSVAQSTLKYMKVSEKQAYVLAKFADENGIKYE